MNEIKKIAYNCHQATLLIEKKQLTKLSLREKFELKLHLSGCSVCRVFQQQSMLINKLVKSYAAAKKEETLDEAYKKKLQEQIDNKLI